MIYYKHIGIDNFELIREKTEMFIFSNMKLNTGFSMLDWKKYISFCPEILDAFKLYHMFPTKGGLYITSKQQDSAVHIDYKNENVHLCRINIPILNCEGSRTEFYTGGSYLLREQLNNKLAYYEVSPFGDKPTKVDEVELIRPTVIRIQEPHRVNVNLNKVPRICMTLFMNIDPVSLLNNS